MDTLSNSELLSQILDSDVGVQTAAAIRKDAYRELVVFGNLTSYSMQKLLQSCPRKFQLTKLGADLNEEDEEGNCDFAFGHAVGAGVAVYDQTKDLRKAHWAAFLAWNIDLLEEPYRKPGRPDSKKTFFNALWAISVYSVFYEEETDLDEYEIVKAEATVAIDFEDGHFYVGHIDELLKHKATGRFKVKENKTTVYSTVDPAIYSNTDQALSYAVVIDQLGESEYDVLYTVYSSTEQRWLQFEFSKSSLQKAEWLQGQFFFHQQIEDYETANLFPKNGESCMQYNRRCKFYESCDYNHDRVYGKTFADLKKLESVEQLNEIEQVDYSYKFLELKKSMKKERVIPILPAADSDSASMEEM